MNLHSVIHASTRPDWTARLVVFIALVVAISLAVEIIQVLLW